MLSLDNTEIAFRSKTNSELKKAWWMFRFISNPKFVQFCKPLAAPALWLGGPFSWMIKHTFFNHFCGGESINDCDITVKRLARHHVQTILDYSVEGKETEADFDRTAGEIIQTQERAGIDIHIPFNVFKLTGLARFGLLESLSNGSMLTRAESEEYERVKIRVESIFKKAAEINRSIMIDAEESWIQPVIDRIALDGMRRYNRDRAIVYNTIQLYRRDGLQILQRLAETAAEEGFIAGVKIVRGAYMEKERERAKLKQYPDPIQPDKAAADRDFNLALRFIADHSNHIALCAGTHNEASTLLLAGIMKEKGIPADHPHFWFSQLLGMSDHISFNLASAGYNVAKYVPYGPLKDVLPYLIRRAEENTSVSGQTGRELALLSKEIKRRKALEI